MLNIPSGEDETKLLESDLKKDAGLLSNAFSHKSCDRVDIEHEMTITIAAGILKKAFGYLHIRRWDLIGKWAKQESS